MEKVALQVSLVVITCCWNKCGIQFAVPEYWECNRREDHAYFFCPNGHEQSFIDKTEAEKLREQLNKANAEKIAAAASADRMRKERDNAVTAQKRETTRRKNLQKRVTAGLCPYCNRSFVQMQRHIHSKHPEHEHKPEGALV